jgi:hypothetical protein
MQNRVAAMPSNVVVWDLETVPDLRGFAAANDLDGKSDDEIREAMGDKFPSTSTICIQEGQPMRCRVPGTLAA